MMLEDLNYQCTAAANGEEGLQLFPVVPSRYAAVLTDQTIPVMTGMEMSTRILKKYPSTRIILCSGFSHTATKQDAILLGIRYFLDKPIHFNKLSKTLHNLFKT